MPKAAASSAQPKPEPTDIESTGPSEFGRWLYDTRKKKELTLEDLSDKSGISYVQIWNLENGRSRNPQDKTRKKLTDALGEEPSSAIVRATEKEAEIKGVGELEDFDPHNPVDLPAKAGVYVFYDISGRAIYVGQSQNIKQRIEQDHLSRFWFKAPIVQSAKYIEIKNKQLREKIERTMIKFLDATAVINKQHVDRSQNL